MNKMPILEATLPARDECLFPTQADARHHFARLHLFGKISCGIAYTDNNECELVWLMQTRDGQHYPLQAFAAKFLTTVKSFVSVRKTSAITSDAKIIFTSSVMMICSA